MRIVIACSKSWFELPETLSRDHDVLVIVEQSGLSKERLDKFAPDLIFFPHWSWIVPSSVYERYECIVFHTAPLPYGRGGSPIQNLILRGFKSAPVCALRMGPVVDGGGIYGRVEISLDGALSDIFKRMNKAIETLIDLVVNKSPEPIPQAGEATEFRRLTLDDNHIDQGLTLDEVYDRIRMLDHCDYPNAYIIVGDYKIEFLNARKDSESLDCAARISLVKTTESEQ